MAVGGHGGEPSVADVEATSSNISSFLFPSRGFIPNVCKEQIKDLIKDIKEPQVRLQQSDIYIDPTD